MKILPGLLLASFLLGIGNCAIWKTEEAYIIDDLPENDVETTPNGCQDSQGAQGQCIPKDVCNKNYKFLETQNPDRIFEGVLRHVNGSDLESCTPKNPTEDPLSYVCCTSVDYAGPKDITLEEYSKMTANESDATPPTIPTVETGSIEPLITNGDRASPGEFPFAIAIIYNGHQICGGSLIDSQWVVSAAHCFDRFTSQSVRSLLIKIGDHDISSVGDARHQDIKVAKLFLHPGFFRQKTFFRDDIALIKLRSPVSPSSNIRTVSLHSGSPSLSGGYATAIVCGWGKVCDGASCPQSSVLRKTTVGIVSQSTCSQRYSQTMAPPITQNMICAGGTGGKDACNGDSGGPLVFYSGGQTYQIGIVSWGIGCGQYPGVYTRVSSFVSWVQKHKNKP